jgi:hypothetical protein
MFDIDRALRGNVFNEFHGSRWIEPDSLLAVTYRQGVMVSGKNRWESSKLQLYTLRFGEEGFFDSRLIFESDSLVPCGTILYRPEDSLLFFSYLPFTSRNGGDIHCDAYQTPGRQIVAGKWGSEPFTPAPEPLDTAGLLFELSYWENRFNDGSISMTRGSICFGQQPTFRCVWGDDL